MSFDTDVVKPGRGRALRVDISLDGFATIAYRYSDVAGVLDGTNQYLARVLNVDTIRRAFGQDRIIASGTTSLRLDNADGGLDWICGRTNIVSAATARFRIYVTLYDPTASPLVFTAKMLGEFVLSAWPTHNNVSVQLDLADDFMGKLGPGLLLPTLLDWQAVGTASTNPIKNAIGIPQRLSQNTPVGLAFGEDVLFAFPHIIPWENQAFGTTYAGKVIVPLYSTTDLSVVSQDLVQQVIVERFRTPEFVGQVEDSVPVASSLPRTIYDSILRADVVIWTVEKSPTIAKGGLSFQIVYLVVDSYLDYAVIYPYDLQDPNNPAGLAQAIERRRALQFYGGYPTDAVMGAGTKYAQAACRVANWYVRTYPGSQRTNPPAANFTGIAHAIDIATDLVSVYSSATVDATSAARVKAGSPFTAASGVVQPWSERANNQSKPPLPMSLRQVLTELAQSSDFDIFLNWSGQIAFSSGVTDFTTATQASGLVEIDETELNHGISRWIPSDGERHSPFNRVSFTGGKRDPTNYGDVPFQGPFDLATADIPISTRNIEVVLRQGWRPYRQQALDPWQWRSVDGVTRDKVRFSTHMGGLRLDLGDYFRLNWTRGPQVGGPYVSTTFQVESISYSPYGNDTVEIEGIWRDDTVTERQYLLDDETLLVRAKNASNSALGVLDASTNVTIATGTDSFVTMGVAAGDILILRDATQAADIFTRNRAIRILARVSATSITVVSADLDFSAPGGAGVASSDWSIVRGATTYPTAVSDPTNYPSGGSMYGKATAAAGTTSDSQLGNRLISG